MATLPEKLEWYIFEHRDISQKEFAQESGIQEATISRVLTGKQYPSVPTLMLLRDTTGIWGDYWLDDRAKVPPTRRDYVTSRNNKATKKKTAKKKAKKKRR